MSKNKSKLEQKPDSKPKVVANTTNSFFKPNKNANKAPHCVQNVNVEVNIDQKEDCTTGCFKGLASMFKK